MPLMSKFGRLLSKSAYNVIFLWDKMALYIRLLLYLTSGIQGPSGVRSAASPSLAAFLLFLFLNGFAKSGGFFSLAAIVSGLANEDALSPDDVRVMAQVETASTDHIKDIKVSVRLL